MNDSGWSLLDLYKKKFPQLYAQDLSPSFERQVTNKFVAPIQDSAQRVNIRQQLGDIFKQNPELLLDYIYKDNMRRYLYQQNLRKTI